MSFSAERLKWNHSKLRERNTVYRGFGYDIRASLEFVLSKVKPIRGRVLEIGTGKGRFTVPLAARAERLSTIDIDRSEQQYAKMNAAYEGVLRNIRFLQQDVYDLRWKRPTFDLTASMNALHHFPDVPGAVREIIRVTRSDGKIVLSDFNEEGFRAMDRLHESEGRVHDRVIYDWDELAGVFREAGWTPRFFEGCHQALIQAFGPKSGFRSRRT